MTTRTSSGAATTPSTRPTSRRSSRSSTRTSSWHLPGESQFADDYQGRDAIFAHFGQLGERHQRHLPGRDPVLRRGRRRPRGRLPAQHRGAERQASRCRLLHRLPAQGRPGCRRSRALLRPLRLGRVLVVATREPATNEKPPRAGGFSLARPRSAWILRFKEREHHRTRKRWIMRRLAAVLLATVAALLTLVGSSGAITGGQLDGNGHPNVAMIFFYQPDGRFRCSATLVSPTVLVTAAHCTDGVRGKVIATFDSVAPTPTPRAADDPGDGTSSVGYSAPVTGWLTGTPHAHPLWAGKLKLNDLHDVGVVVLDAPYGAGSRGTPAAQLSRGARERQRWLEQADVHRRRLRRLLREADRGPAEADRRRGPDTPRRRRGRPEHLLAGPEARREPEGLARRRRLRFGTPAVRCSIRVSSSVTRVSARASSAGAQAATTVSTPTTRACSSTTTSSAPDAASTARESHADRACTTKARICGLFSMELGRLELPTSWVRSRRSPN